VKPHDLESYKDANGFVFFRLDPETGSCIEAMVSARRGDGMRRSYFGRDAAPTAFLPTREEREGWARSSLAELAD